MSKLGTDSEATYKDARNGFRGFPLNQIVCGDCLEVLPALKEETIDMCVIDPPYSSGTRQVTNRVASQIPKRGEKWNKAGVIWDSSFSSFGLSIFLNVLLQQVKRVLREHAHVYIFIDWRHYPLLTMSLEGSGLFINNLIVWDKGAYTLGGNYRSQYELIVFSSRGTPRRLNTTTTGNVLKYKRVINGKHPTQKPIKLLRKLILSASKKDNIILDPMCGSGTTCLGADQLDRKWIGIEINPEYVEMANKRLGKQSQKLTEWTP